MDIDNTPQKFNVEREEEEELLVDKHNGKKYTTFPIEYNNIWKMYKQHVSAFWTPEEIDLSKDIDDWIKLSDNERYFITHILAFFAASDGIVNENLAVRFLNDVQPNEAKAFYGFQIAMENIHCVTGDTEVLTDKGYCSIMYLAKQKPCVNVWNGHEFSNVRVQQTSQSSDIYEVILSNGMVLKCTSEHKWLIQEEKINEDDCDESLESLESLEDREPKGDEKCDEKCDIEQKCNEQRVFTKHLIPGMKLIDFVYPEQSEDTNVDFEIFSNPDQHGLACSQYESSDYDLLKFQLRPKYYVPMSYSKDTQAKWLSGLFSRNTNIDMSDTEEFLTLKSNNRQFLSQVQLLLTCLNIKCTLKREDDVIFMLSFNILNVMRMIKKNITLDLPFNISSTDTMNTKDQSLCVCSVTKLRKREATYCFNEPLRHTGIFNGILTGQSETYSLLIDTYIKDENEKTKVLNAVQTIPCIKKKADWALKWISSESASFATRLIAFACVEGIFFSGAFCSIFWLKEKGIMPGLCLSNEFISRDEGLHTEFACLLYTYIKHKLSQEDVHKIIIDAVSIESEFINTSLPCNLLGMNADLMNEYIKFVADRLVFQLGYEKIWNVKNPFDFMDRISLENKTNFFEHTRLSEYAKTNVGNDTTSTILDFSMNSDF
jgi:ribonucleotide reductase beta subunit family protein with ferritin-like domain